MTNNYSVLSNSYDKTIMFHVIQILLPFIFTIPTHLVLLDGTEHSWICLN
jgi:hypothetical protein